VKNFISLVQYLNSTIPIDDRSQKLLDHERIMAGWKLEVFRIALYLSFPVACFTIFNHPKFYEKVMMDVKDQITNYDVRGLEYLKELSRKKRMEKMEEAIRDMNKTTSE